MANTWKSSVSPIIAFLTLAWTNARKILAAVTALLFAVSCMSQDQPQPPLQPDTQSSAHAAATRQPATVTLPAGTTIALVLTHDILSRSIRRGDNVYAQINFPVNSGNQVVIPPSTFVQGRVDKLEQKRGRAELHLQSMSITFPDGYVAPISGPVTLESDEGYARKDPGQGRTLGFVAMPVAGAGLGALIGHSVASSQDSTITSSLPPGCIGPPPGCLSSSLSVPPNKGKSTVIGAAVARIRTTTHSNAANPVAPPPPSDTNHGTCYTPGTPGTPDTVIPGAPGPNGISGPPTTIPGIPPTPGTTYPCP